MVEKSRYRISVAMCTYNGERFIKEQLESILAQTVPVDEIVICDDGSTDKTLDIASEILEVSEIDFQIIQNPICLGVTKNFEKAISLCTGDIIFTCDQDDLWNKDKVKTLLTAFEDDDVIMAFSDADVIDTDGAVVNSSLHKRLLFLQRGQNDSALVDALARQHYTIHGCLMAFRKNFVNTIMPFHESKLNHDAWIMYCASLMGKIKYFACPLISYRIHNNSTTQGTEGQNEWLRIVHSANDYERRFSLNVFRIQRFELIGHACSMKNVKHNAYWYAYKKSLIFYERIKKCETATRAFALFLIIYSWLDGSYNYRFIDRNVSYTDRNKFNIMVSDLIFILRK